MMDRSETTSKKRFPVSWKPPLIFHSKILCLSLLYLITTVSLALYASWFSNTATIASYCVFKLQPPGPSTTATTREDHPHLFTYPPTYGENKHALPASISACNSPLLFPEYRVAYDEIHALCTNSSSSNSSVLRYLTRRGDHGDGNTATTFAGNFSTQKRKSYFNHQQIHLDVEVPCGFLKQFPLRPSDRMAMEECKGVVVASAIFGDYDKIRQPKGLGAQTLATVCFFMFIDESTRKGLNSHNILPNSSNIRNVKIGAWRIVVVPDESLPYGEDVAMNGVIPKHLIHRLFPNSKYNIWVDAKMQLTMDPLLLIHSLLVSVDADMAISKHPCNVHPMEEVVATAKVE